MADLGLQVLYAGQAGIGMVSMDGGRVHGVVYENITMAQTAIPISMYIGARQGRHPRPFHVGSISGITVRNVKDSDCFSDRHGPASWAATLDGQPADPRFNVTRDHAVGPGIHLENVDLSACYRGGGNASERTREPDHAKGEAYGNFDISWDRNPRISQLRAASHALCDMLLPRAHADRAPIGAWNPLL